MQKKRVEVLICMKTDNRRWADICSFEVSENFDTESYKKAALKVDWLVNKLFSTIKKRFFVKDLSIAPDILKPSILTIDKAVMNLIKVNRKAYGSDDDEPYLSTVEMSGFKIPKWGKDNPRD